MTIIPGNPVAAVTDPGGPMVGVCAGARCAALWRLRDGGCGPRHDALDTAGPTAVRRAVRATPGGVLTRLECVGACAEAPLVGVGHRRPDAATTGEISWVVGADEPARHAGLLAWLGRDWTAGPAEPPAGLLPALVRLVRVGVAGGRCGPGDDTDRHGR